MSQFNPACKNCAWLFFIGAECMAYPDGIPDVIWEGDNKHVKPYPGDHGIQFKSIRQAAAEQQKEES